MTESKQIRVAVNGYGVIGKRVAAAVVRQEDMSLAGVSDVVTDWRVRMATRNGFRLFVVVDCTPKRVAAKNIEVYRRCRRKFIVQGGEKHEPPVIPSSPKRTIRARSIAMRRVSCRATRRQSCGRLLRSNGPACNSVPEARCCRARPTRGRATKAGS